MSDSRHAVLLAVICAAAVFSPASFAQDDNPAATAPADSATPAPTDATQGSDSAPAADSGSTATAPASDAAAAAPASDSSAAPAATSDYAASAPAPDASAATPSTDAGAPAQGGDTASDGGTVAAPDTASDESASAAVPWYQSMLPNFDFSIGGFIRTEAAFSTGSANPNNQNGNPYDKITVQRTAYLPPTASATAVNDIFGTLGIPLSVPIPAATTWSSVPLALGTTPLGPNTAGTVQRPIEYTHDVFNMHILRGEVEVGMKLTSDLKVIGRLRGIYDPGHYHDFDARTVNNIYGGITGGDRALYGGRPDYFDYRVEGNSHPNPLEWDGKNYELYFPTLVLDYNHGPLNVRVGNQQIAWGQAIFFRVLDVPDGLDLRRHSLLDYAQEEFSDKRVPALAARVGYQFTDALLADGYVQKFQPTIYGNPNTQYNIIPAQFTVHDEYSEHGYQNKLSYGLRFKGDFGQWGFQMMAARRYNPDGVFRWTKSGVNKDLPNNFADGSLNTLGTIVNVSNGGHAGPQLANTPFEASTGGVYSAKEWFHYAAMVRLNGLTGLNASINEFQPATGNVYASPVTNYTDAYNELNTFFLAGGGSLRGHIAREYFAENDFGLGGSFVTDGAPGSILDQLIINVEMLYTPNRVFTAPSLSGSFLKENNLIGALVLEKYQRFSQYFPATYFVLQYMHRTKDDIFGRSLQGYGGTDTSVAPGIAGGSNYVVFAFQQPFPQDIYRIGFATLYDPRGGILVQPGIQWKPRGSLAFDFFYTYINGDLHGNPNNNALSSVDFADEATVRLSYQF
ncbi:MAG TPA: DUF1302 family protein [Stenotrophobium sp.]|nr:DUF1302 family protein [Stenotrophobium sp.]